MTLEQLESDPWVDPAHFPTDLVRRCYGLRRKPLHSFQIDDCRLMVSQGFSINYVVPIAISYLEECLFAEGSFYQGDLLQAVLNVDRKFWIAHPNLWEKVHELIKDRLGDLDTRKIRYGQFLGAF